MGSLYDQDLVLWTQEQAKALREHAQGSNVAVDWENVAEEIESLGNEQRFALSSHIGTVIEHLLKLQASPAQQPRHQWTATVVRARAEAHKRLRQNPSLRREVKAMIKEELGTARQVAGLSLQEYSEESRINLEMVTYTEAQVLGDWLPD